MQPDEATEQQRADQVCFMSACGQADSTRAHLSCLLFTSSFWTFSAVAWSNRPCCRSLHGQAVSNGSNMPCSSSICSTTGVPLLGHGASWLLIMKGGVEFPQRVGLHAAYSVSHRNCCPGAASRILLAQAHTLMQVNECSASLLCNLA